MKSGGLEAGFGLPFRPCRVSRYPRPRNPARENGAAMVPGTVTDTCLMTAAHPVCYARYMALSDPEGTGPEYRW